MILNTGELYVNRTWKYLFPCLTVYGPEFMSKINSLFKLAVGIDDMNLYGVKKDNCLFILLDSEIPLSTKADIDIYKRNFAKFLSWISYQDYYVTDYVFDDVYVGKRHMVVIKIPEEFKQAYVHFLNGSYSRMYTPYEQARFFKHDKYNVLPVLEKNNQLLEAFTVEVNTRFNTSVRSHELAGTELDFKPVYKEEIFNY